MLITHRSRKEVFQKQTLAHPTTLEGVLSGGGLEASDSLEFPAVEGMHPAVRAWATQELRPRPVFPGSESSIHKWIIWPPVQLFNGKDHVSELSLII